MFSAREWQPQKQHIDLKFWSPSYLILERNYWQAISQSDKS